MIERLLAAEGALERDELDQAQRLFGQVAEADPRNAIALVGLARVLVRRGDTDAARELLDHALQIDPEEAAARRLLDDLAAVVRPEAPARGAPATARPATAGPAPAPHPRRGAVASVLAWLAGLFRRRDPGGMA